MKARIILLLVAAALVAFGVWSILHRGAARTVAAPRATTAHQPPEVPIQDGKTLDFSSGKVVVKDSPAERKKLEQSVKEMDAAASAVTFDPKPVAATTTTGSTAPVTAPDPTKK